MEKPDQAFKNVFFLQGNGRVTAVLRSIDWTKHPLGDPRTWPSQLCQVVDMALLNKNPVLICWGKELLTLFNDSFADLYKEHQENLLPIIGKPITETLSIRSNEGIFDSDALNLQQIGLVGRNDIALDIFFNGIRDDQGTVLGLFGICQVVQKVQEDESVITEQESLQDLNDELATTNEELTASNEELSATNDELASAQQQLHESIYALLEREQQISEMVASAPFPIAVYTGREMTIARANQAIIQVWGKGSDVIGKTYFGLLPELESQDIYPSLLTVFDSGIPFHARNQRVDLTMDGVLTTFYFNYSFTPLHDTSGNIYGIMNTAADVTDLFLAKQQVEQSEANFRNMITQAPVAMCLLLGPEHRIELVNDAMMEIWGKHYDDVIHLPVFQALPDAKEQGLETVMNMVFETGEPFYAFEQPVSLIRHGKPDIVYQNFVYQAHRGNDGTVVGVLAISINVTDQVVARRDVERAFEQARMAKEAAMLGMFDMDLIKGTMEWDKRCRELFGVPLTGEVTYQRDFAEGLHPDDRERALSEIERVFDKKDLNGNYDIEYRTIARDDGRLRWVHAKGKAYFDENDQPVRFIGTVMDITSQKEDEAKWRENSEKQARLAAIVRSSDDIIISKNLDGVITSWNEAAERRFGYTTEEALGKHISLVIPPDRESEEDFIISKVRAGKKINHYNTVRVAKDGTELQLSITVSPIIDDSGTVIGASKIARDISTQIAAQKSAKRYTAHLEIMNMIINAISEELDLNKILQIVTDATTELTGARFGAFFYNKLGDDGESYMLYTLSGADREDFDKFGMPRNTAVFHPTFSGESVVRVDDITKDPRYGKNTPHHGMPKGHLPVVSYLAVPVISRSGKVIGGLFFGHPEPGQFTREHESLVVSIANQAAIGIDNATLYEQVLQLNDKKDEFIGLASHELKTPLASISGYIQILQRFVKDENAGKFLSKASQQVKKLTSLVSDLLDVSKIEAGKLKFTFVEFDLREIIEEAIELTSNTADKYQIDFISKVDKCVMNGDSQRIEQVLINLLSNAIKYSPGSDRVEVTLDCTNGRAMVGIRDFGMGIAADKLKNIFSRFYRIDEAAPNISGLGIGLYLSHEIITRHNGEIRVESEKGKGSTFTIDLPILPEYLSKQ